VSISYLRPAEAAPVVASDDVRVMTCGRALCDRCCSQPICTYGSLSGTRSAGRLARPCVESILWCVGRAAAAGDASAAVVNAPPPNRAVIDSAVPTASARSLILVDRTSAKGRPCADSLAVLRLGAAAGLPVSNARWHGGLIPWFRTRIGRRASVGHSMRELARGPCLTRALDEL
jgi:hypothetical protein